MPHRSSATRVFHHRFLIFWTTRILADGRQHLGRNQNIVDLITNHQMLLDNLRDYLRVALTTPSPFWIDNRDRSALTDA
jgi:hypothetical protein